MLRYTVVHTFTNRLRLLCTALLMLCAGVGYAQPSAHGGGDDNMIEDILYYVNQHRKDIGKPPIELINGINKECTVHSKDMATGREPFGHDGFEDRVARINKSFKHCSGAGENVAYGKLNAEKVVQLWLKSPGHRRNIEGDFKYSGIGVATAKDGTTWFTQMFVSAE